MILSPTVIYSETRDSFYRSISIGGLGSWSYSFAVKEGDTVDDSISSRLKIYDYANVSDAIFNVIVYEQPMDIPPGMGHSFLE